VKTAVLVDELDKRIGKLQIPESCFVIQHAEATFVRTEQYVRLYPRQRSGGVAVVFQQTEPFVRARLEAI
jgi:hypothetical protein